MMYFAECTVTVRFTEEEVIEWLVDNEAIDEDEADIYKPTFEQLQDYAWERIEEDDGEYGSITIS